MVVSSDGVLEPRRARRDRPRPPGGAAARRRPALRGLLGLGRPPALARRGQGRTAGAGRRSHRVARAGDRGRDAAAPGPPASRALVRRRARRGAAARRARAHRRAAALDPDPLLRVEPRAAAAARAQSLRGPALPRARAGCASRRQAAQLGHGGDAAAHRPECGAQLRPARRAAQPGRDGRLHGARAVRSRPLRRDRPSRRRVGARRDALRGACPHAAVRQDRRALSAVARRSAAAGRSRPARAGGRGHGLPGAAAGRPTGRRRAGRRARADGRRAAAAAARAVPAGGKELLRRLEAS